ncbi:o-succinylbenzoate synthase [[Haemophilus] ducreyi]|uniref:o-succinylbenzoate synthase n=1 Tax=Haemophilus ducreyi TaxID=730 RepID=UPI000655AC28|nr:o-succinylbenzoate synthase [[Haemophilus] ducreyi]AKO45378.1 O-succinylbenzoate synthase [[Haemophilus] ducreyi]AKO46763.1 O-succinylbenzoate synthase [[Haemophilus] ducreyi]AKO48103.1 O-succinylbenzoate synthase [[Haemophilus] ducreyi]AKO49489.1 O-succinylbenzoate synthase [[Haemophilus] ducreyi]ANF61474.1 o-succinylbenzoate synthase [[Haemophilus] ducreyi]
MRSAKLYRYVIPVETGTILRNRRLKQRDGLLIQLQDNQRVGWGEIAPLPEFSHETLVEAEQQIRDWLVHWGEGDLPDLTSYAPSVAFGVSCALAELGDQLIQQANYRAALLCYGDPDELYSSLTMMSGEKTGKMKVGLYEANRDGLMANMLLEALPELHLRLDANRSWSLEKALKFAEKIADQHKAQIQFIEEPCQTPELSRQFAQQSGIAIAWDETVCEADFVVKKEPNLAAIVIKPTLVGSLQKCIGLIEQAHQQGLIAVISSSLESSLGLTQLARFAQQYTPCTMPGLDTLNLMKTQILRQWPNSNLPIADLNSPFITELVL